MRALKIGFVAAETSADRLGGALIRALREQVPDLEVFGVSGDSMRAAGCRSLADISELSVIGLAEIFMQLPRLLAYRRRLVRRLAAEQPDLVVGIDAPDLNLPLERALRRRGVRTVHYVSPSVWAWRAGRVKTVARAVEAVLCLLPFEPECYRDVSVRAEFTGHPLADALQPQPAEPARAALGLRPEGRVLTVLPGSRQSEIERLAQPFLDAAAVLARDREDLQVVVPAANTRLKAMLEAHCRARANFTPSLIEGRAEEAIAAADVVLAASGTVTLETMLLNRPMVVAYRMSALSAWLLLGVGLLRTPHFSLPNLLSGREIVPELAQENAGVAKISEEVGRLLDDPSARAAQCETFAVLRNRLGRNAAGRAARVLLELLDFPGDDTRDESN
jgi:lipid-A-disaccharide synthase